MTIREYRGIDHKKALLPISQVEDFLIFAEEISNSVINRPSLFDKIKKIMDAKCDGCIDDTIPEGFLSDKEKGHKIKIKAKNIKFNFNKKTSEIPISRFKEKSSVPNFLAMAFFLGTAAITAYQLGNNLSHIENLEKKKLLLAELKGRIKAIEETSNCEVLFEGEICSPAFFSEIKKIISIVEDLLDHNRQKNKEKALFFTGLTSSTSLGFIGAIINSSALMATGLCGGGLTAIAAAARYGYNKVADKRQFARSLALQGHIYGMRTHPLYNLRQSHRTFVTQVARNILKKL